MGEETEKLVRTTVYIEDEIIEAIEEFAEKYTRETGKRWSKSAVIRLALSEFFTRQGRML